MINMAKQTNGANLGFEQKLWLAADKLIEGCDECANEKKNRLYTAIDLFCGAGGTSLGLQKQGFQIRAAVDIDKDAIATYQKNIGIQPIRADIRKLTVEELLKAANLSKGQLTILAGCPPCQGFSQMRRHAVKDKRNHLVVDFTRFVEGLKPEFVVFENVTGILHPNNKKYFQCLTETLTKLGYKYIYQVLNAADYGVPQIRRRLVLLATRNSESYSALRMPEKMYGSPSLIQSNRILNPWRGVREAIRDLPPIRAGSANTLYSHHDAPVHTAKVMTLIKHVPKNGGSRVDLPRSLWLKCHKKHGGHKDVYGRMRWDKPSPCITSGCTSASKGRYLHPTQNRTITLREAARLQTFPDKFQFEGNRSSIARQVGNAVPVVLMESIIQCVKIAMKSPYFTRG